jgi:hypothetical protein
MAKIDMEGKILQFVKDEKSKIEDATQEIRVERSRARRNYEMKYDDPYDSVTKKRKIFVPLTKQEVDLIAPRFEMDPEALFITAFEPGLEKKALIWQELIRNVFTQMDWKYRTKQAFYPFTNEGNMVTEMFWDAEKKLPDFTMHDVKNVFLFPQEPDMQSASMFGIKRRVLYEHFMASPLYKNKDMVTGSTRISDTNFQTMSQMRYEIGKSEYRVEMDEVELYERYGYFPKSFFTGNPEDESELVDGVITVANVERTPVLVRITDESERWRFAEAWYLKRLYSWYAMGVGVALRDYQFYYNKIVNRRDNNEDVLHHGMFVKRRGMNIDARQRMTGAGIWIEADNPADLVQLRTNDVTTPSYTGEQNLLSAVQRLNGTYDILRGTGTTYSASEAAIKDKNVGTRLEEPQKHIDRMFEKCVFATMRLLSENAPKDMIVKLTGRDEELAKFDDFKLATINKVRASEGLEPISKQEFQGAMQPFGATRYLKIPSMKFLDGEFHVKVDNDASLLKSKAGMAQLVMDAMKVAAQVPGVPQTIDFADLFEQWLNLNGLKVKRIEQASPVMGVPPAPTGSGGSAEMFSQTAAPVAEALNSLGASRPNPVAVA